MTNRQQLEQLLTEQLDEAYRFAYSYTRNEAMAEDVVSESAMKALKHVDTVKNPQYMKTWFYRIIINTAMTMLKREQKVVTLLQEEQAEERKMAPEEIMDLHQLLEQMEEKYRTVVILRFFEDMTLEEIAEVLQENLNTVKSRLYRGLAMLKVEMEEAI